MTRLVGYARVSTEEQATDAQVDALRAAGCQVIYEEYRSGSDRNRPELGRVLKDLRRGDILVIVRLDRLARSLSHLISVVEDLTGRGVHLRSLGDPIDTSTPQGMFSLQVLGAVAQLERALIRERTKAGIKAAQARGRRPGNPGLRAGDADAIRKVVAARNQRHVAALIDGADAWLPTVRQMRPDHSWQAVTVALRRQGQDWTEARLKRAVRRLVSERLVEISVLGRAAPSHADTRLMRLVGAIVRANPALSLRAVGAQLEGMRERAPRGGTKWLPSSVKHLLDRARAQGLVQ